MTHHRASVWPTEEYSFTHFTCTGSSDAVDLILVVDVSGSMGPYLTTARTFIDDVISQLTIGQSNVRVALVRFLSTPEVTWSLDSAQSGSYDNVTQGINEYLTSSGSIGTVDSAFDVVVSDVIGSTGDRANAANVVITVGDGDGTNAQSPFCELGQYTR